MPCRVTIQEYSSEDEDNALISTQSALRQYLLCWRDQQEDGAHTKVFVVDIRHLHPGKLDGFLLGIPVGSQVQKQ